MISLLWLRRAGLLRATLAGACLFSASFMPSLGAQTSGYIFSTLAGRSLMGWADGSADRAAFAQPTGVAVDQDGNIFVADTYNQTVRRISPTRVVTTIAGEPGNPGSSDGNGAAAHFNSPCAVAVSRFGQVYVADAKNHTIRVIAPDHTVTTLAGLAGVAGSADGPGSDARFNTPAAIAVDLDGNVYVADSGNATVRKIAPDGRVSTLAGLAGNPGSDDGVGSAARFITPSALAVDRTGHVFVTDVSAYTIRAIAPDGTVTTVAGLAHNPGTDDGTGSAARFSAPGGIAVDSADNLYVTDYINCTVRKISPTGVVITLAGAAQQTGDVDGTGSAARFNGPGRAAVDANGNVYVADAGNGTIRQVAPDGTVTTIAGLSGSAGYLDGTGGGARFNNPNGIASDAAGNIYVAEGSNRTVRKVTPAGVVTTFAGAAGQFGSADGVGGAARFGYPDSLATDAAGNVYVSDGDNFNIRKIASDGTVSTLAGQTGYPGWTNGTGSDAQFTSPAGMAVDSAGNLYVADRDGPTIRKITPAGVVTTYAGREGQSASIDGPPDVARLIRPESVAIDRAGNLFVTDGQLTVRKIAPDGTITTIAGRWGSRGTVDGPGTAARFTLAYGLAIDPLGNLFVTDLTNVIRRIDPSGMVTTVAGTASNFGGTDGSDAFVRFNYPIAITLDPFGNLYVADSSNNTIRQAVSTTRLVNLSVRSHVGTGDQTLIVGFVVAGTGPKPLLIRGIGPTLASMGVLSGVADPEFKVFDHTGQAILANDDWGGAADLSAVFARLGAFPLDPASKDAALYSTLAPGLYTTQVYGVDSSGVALAELYDGDFHVTTRLVNVSARAVTQGGDNILIAGFVLAGTAPKTVLLRGIGPSLVNQGLSAASVLADPRIALYHNGANIASNDDWGGTAALQSAFQTVGAFALDPASKDAALLVTLDPGIYSVLVSGANGTSGVALVEVYETP